MKDRGITEKGEKWVMDWSEMQNLVIVGKFYACLPILFPHCRKKPNLNPNKLIFIKRGFLVSLIYCFLSRLTEDPYFIVSYNCCVWYKFTISQTFYCWHNPPLWSPPAILRGISTIFLSVTSSPCPVKSCAMLWFLWHITCLLPASFFNKGFD